MSEKLIFGDPDSLAKRDRARDWNGPGKMHANKPTDSVWRKKAREVVLLVMREFPETNGKELRKLIQSRYPFGIRQYTPYKIWCQEVRLQTEYHGRDKEKS